MKKFIITAVALCLTISNYAQQTINSRQLEAFNKIELTGKLMVQLIQADSTAIDISLTKTELSKIDWGVRNGTLSVRLKPGSSADGMAEVKIYYKSLNELKLSGSNVAIKDAVNSLVLDIEMVAGATLGAQVNTKDVLLKASGNSSATLSGTTKYLTISAGSKSKVDCRQLETTDAKVDANSAAEVYVSATERLQLLADTGSSIYYRGEPEIFRSATKLLGTINNIGK